uniref:Uncharacterized protein n=1 Tax=Hordeum vulgare subsp. vulgare TaxID=112509 RepID=A0A8I7B6F4_HORVV
MAAMHELLLPFGAHRITRIILLEVVYYVLLKGEQPLVKSRHVKFVGELDRPRVCACVGNEKCFVAWFFLQQTILLRPATANISTIVFI